jgi:hypothetical protein
MPATSFVIHLSRANAIHVGHVIQWDGARGLGVGNKTKKLSYLKLGAIPKVVEILATEQCTHALVQSAAAVGRCDLPHAPPPRSPVGLGLEVQRRCSYCHCHTPPLPVVSFKTRAERPTHAAGRPRSFACGLDEGVQAVLDSNAVPHLLRTLANADEKVVEAGARSLKQILNVRHPLPLEPLSPLSLPT